MSRARFLGLLVLCVAVACLLLESALVQNVQANVADCTWAMQHPDLQRTGTGNCSCSTAPNLEWSLTTEQPVAGSRVSSVDGMLQHGACTRSYDTNPDGTQKWRHGSPGGGPSADSGGSTNIFSDIVKRAAAIIDWFLQQFTTVSNVSAEPDKCSGEVPTNVTVNAAGNTFFSELLGAAEGFASWLNGLFHK